MSDLMRPCPAPPATRPRAHWRPQRWAVVGASGFIGSATVERLSLAGVDVLELPGPRVTLDPGTGAGALATMAETHPDIASLAARLAGIDVVVNAAGMAAPGASATPEIFGANSLLPAMIASAARRAGVGRVIHLSSAAVQGRRLVLDESTEVEPFSAYSRSKALGERAILAMGLSTTEVESPTDLVIIRATSVQGPGRPTTESLRRIARSPLSSVSAPGSQPSVVSSLTGLTDFIYRVGMSPDSLPPILLQPWEGFSAEEVLRAAGGRSPVRLPAWLCRGILIGGRALGAVVPGLTGAVRRVELMWFGQGQTCSPTFAPAQPNREPLRAILQGGGSAS